jgi:hypothetical protein
MLVGVLVFKQHDDWVVESDFLGKTGEFLTDQNYFCGCLQAYIIYDEWRG